MRIPSNSIKDITRFFREELAELYTKGEVDAFIEYCCEAFSGLQKHEIGLKENETVNESTLLQYSFAVKELKVQKPIQYILGEADFYGAKFLVNEYTLIPRPETEELVHLIINDCKEIQTTILDIGTGSGCIAISLAKKMSKSAVSALDISQEALVVAKKNAIKNGVSISFICQSILEKAIDLPMYDVIVSNPPYVRNLEKQAMSANVLAYEPHLALFVSDTDPLLFYNAIAEFALTNLNPQGKLYVEINEYLGAETQKLLTDKGFKNVEVLKDLNGKKRILRCNK